MINTNYSKKQIKWNEKQNEKLQNLQLNYAPFEYIQEELESDKKIIENQIYLPSQVKQNEEDSMNENINLQYFRDISKDKEFSQNIYLTNYWEFNQAKLEDLRTSEIQKQFDMLRNGDELEPLREIYLTDFEISIALTVLSNCLTDGIIEYLRRIYDPEKDYSYLTDSQKTIINKFVQYLPQYSIVLLNQQMPFDKKQFIETHYITYKVKISKQIHKDNHLLCDVFLRYEKFSEYEISLRYFMQKKLEVLIDQKFNSTKELIKALQLMYNEEKNKIQTIAENSSVTLSTCIHTQQKIQPNEESFNTKLDYSQTDNESPLKKDQLQSKILPNYIIIKEEKADKVNQEQKKQSNLINGNFTQKNKENSGKMNLQKQDNVQKDLFQQKHSKDLNILCNQNKKKGVNVLQLNLDEKQKLIQDKIQFIEFIISKVPVVKQKFHISKNEKSIQQVLQAYKSINSIIEKARELNQKVNIQQINTFLTAYKSKKIDNILNEIKRSNKKYFV
ncbi:hypothetical protein TTHERM_01085480 (macronuclear) [Tetrahymena thermophila SB210]|uniref:Uncharacterized protein n=1 Tax=Tetrahymena thermophila (strain SB210) TaxID=312017 RepID=Q22BS1_TETTS|nr:hypothetical protein TTHERM_01085480 [Tetrahymena thermophila SB210]EAR82718.2 hypothetical protein TTHERM_01085480 [Tetrahymena thermophila SB210]|eukprot:XP_001030381.2 hypothetical protein TTHERM_01085480 [Tetrahymena thermophila SB210]